MKKGAGLGQHFMIDEKVLSKVVDIADIGKDDKVLEIGPGRGALTGLLLKKCSVSAIERDGKLIEELKSSYPDLDLIYADAIKADWPRFNKCVSNLPYQISKKFVLKLLQQKFDLCVVVLQREFAKKLVAKPGDKSYGVVSVCAQFCSDMSLLDEIPKNAFRPQPKVKSQIVQIVFKIILEPGFLAFLTRIFQKRNRKLGEKRARDYSPEQLFEIYKRDEDL
jgi:16S rRNA (adenine1518-N6/adenine1519-N6)-dimethyltransferase